MKFTAPKNNLIALFLKPIFCLIAVSVFTFTANSQTNFTQQAKLTATDGASQDSHGFSVAISGDTAVVGSPRNTGGTNLQNRGSAYVYVRNSAGAWTFQQKLAPSDGAATDQFGYSVAINGNTIAVGRYNTTTGLNRADGKVYIFTRTGTAWTQTQTIQSSDIAQGDLFGNSLSFDGDTLVVGALNKNNGNNFFQGAAYVFTRNGGTGNFAQQAKLVSNDGGLADFFGYSVALSGDTIVIGTPGQAGLGGASGRGWAYVFTRSGSSWSFQQKILASDGAAGDAFGTSVSISGETIVVGARMDMIGTVGGQGSAYVFSRSGSVWSEQQKLLGIETIQRNDNFGYSVAIKGDTIAVGSPAHEYVSNIANHGAVYIFQRSSGGSFSRTQKLLHGDPAPDALGTSVAFDGNSILTGAPSKDSARGAAYVFNSAQINFSPLGFDFDGDGKSDLSVFRPSSGSWYIQRSSAGFAGLQFGLSADKIVPADYDGDEKTDVAVWRESEGNFYILNSSNNSVRVENFGLAGDIPVTVGDWDGDGKADLSVYRNGASGGQSYFFYRGSNNNPSGNITYLPWGTTEDKPVRGDFDGDGKIDTAIFRPSNGVWYIRNSSDGAIRYEGWGLATDRLVPADYDGDGKTDIAVYRDGNWYIKQSSNNQPKYETFGLASDQLTAADFDGDGKDDIAVFRNGIWYIKQSSSASISYQTFGANGDKAIQYAFVQ